VSDIIRFKGKFSYEIAFCRG